MQQGIDSRAMFAVLVTRLPRLLILAVAGAVLGSGLNLVVMLSKAKDICYVAETEYYIEFAEGRYEMRDYYNAFTWNEYVLGSDLVLGRAMAFLDGGYDRNQVKEMLSAEMLSDVRYLTIYVRGREPARVEEVRNAVQKAMEELGAAMDEFDRIYQIDDLEIVQEEISYFGWRPAFLGAAIAVCTGVFVILFCFCMGSVFYTKGDISVRLGIPACGMTFREGRGRKRDGIIEQRQARMLAENLEMLTERYPRILLMDACGGQQAAAFLEDIRSREPAGGSCFQLYSTDVAADAAADAAAVVAVIPFGKPYREKIADEIDHVRMHGGKVVAAVLAQADRNWMRIYYAGI